jgi:hypothetical protein
MFYINKPFKSSVANRYKAKVRTTSKYIFITAKSYRGNKSKFSFYKSATFYKFKASGKILISVGKSDGAKLVRPTIGQIYPRGVLFR